LYITYIYIEEKDKKNEIGDKVEEKMVVFVFFDRRSVFSLKFFFHISGDKSLALLYY